MSSEISPPAPQTPGGGSDSLTGAAGPRDHRLALAVGGVLLAAFAATAPWARAQWPAVPAFVPAYDTAVIVLDSITAWLLYAHYRRSGDRAVLALCGGYTFTPIVVAAHGLSFPDAFVSGALVGGEQTTAWLWMGWHCVFPLFVAAYALIARRDAARGHLREANARRAVIPIAISSGLAVAVTFVALAESQLLPRLMHGSRYLAATQAVLMAGWMAHLAALALLLWTTGARRVLDLWLALAVLAMLIDLALSAIFVTGRFQAGFYLGRVYGLLGVGFVLFVLLRESVAASDDAAVAMDRVRKSDERVMADLRDLRLLRDLGAQLVAEGDHETFYEEIVRAAMALTGANGGSVEIVDADSGTPRLVASIGVFEPSHRSAQSTPLITRSGRTIGMVSAHWAEPRQLGERELRYLDLLARQAADLIEQRQSEETLRRAHVELEARVVDRTAALAAEVRERRAAEARAKALLGRVMSVQEEERKRIARDIHDQIGQQITALRMSLESIRAGASDDARLVAATERAARVAEELDSSIDALTRELRPAILDHLGLTAALENLVRSWSERFGVPADFQDGATSAVRLSADTEANLYRIAQEALHNIYKHARATMVRVTFGHADGCVQLVIQDDGRGFSPVEVHETSVGGLGLESMRERASLIGGDLVVRSAWGHGTTITVRVPAAAGVM